MGACQLKLEEQLRAEVTELFAQAEQADTEAQPSLDIPEELKRREDRLAAIAQAKAEIERRAQVRDEAERAAYEEKLERRRKKEKETGKKMGGRPPQVADAGSEEAGSGELHGRGITHHAVNGRLRAGLQRTSGSGCGQPYGTVTNHVTDHCNDKQEVAPTLQQLDALPDAVGKPEGLLADAGYFSQDNVARCEAEDVTPYISFGREQHHQSLAERCEPVPECPPDADAVTRMQHRLKTPARQSSIRTAQIHGGDGVWDCQGSNGVPAVPCPRIGGGQW